ncbi:MAG: transcriptional regulator [Acidimicrobiales bacterium]|nr:MAG: transcriptional regulator [Acidimicrobiales bacterium]
MSTSPPRQVGGRPRSNGNPRLPSNQSSSIRSSATTSKPPSTESRPSRKGVRWGRIFLILIGFMAILGFSGLACGLYFADSLDKRLHRTDAFDQITGGRPTKLVNGAMNVLIIGSDSRAPGEDPGVNGDRSDSLMIAHLDRNHGKAYLVSIPRDLWVSVPRDSAGNGGQKAKINAASAWGGIPLTVRTVELLTDVRIDHIVKIDFGGFKRMTDALGGVDVAVKQTVTDPRSKRTFTQGMNHLDGAAALDYVRQRYGLPRGDFDRIVRQHIFLRALLQKATDTGTLTSPGKMKSFLEATADTVTVDRKFSLPDTAVQLRKIRSDDVSFITMPVSGSQNIDGQSVVISDRVAAGKLFGSVAQDDVAGWLRNNPASSAAIGN